MIIFDEGTRMFHLQTPKTSYVMKLYGDYILEHVYWGRRINSLCGVDGEVVELMNVCAKNYEYSEYEEYVSTEVHPQEYSCLGSVDLRKPAFHAQYEDGSRITKMKYVSHKIYAGKPKLKGLPATYVENDTEADTLEITMHDDVTGLTLVYRYTAFNEYDAISRNVEVVNEGSQVIDLKTIMSCSLDFGRCDFEMLNMSGAWGREQHIVRRDIQPGTAKIESRRGASGHWCSPFFALMDKGASEIHGDVYGFSLVYSGNFEAGAEVDAYGQTRAFMGINSLDFNWRLERGEEFTAPEVVMVYSAEGLGQMSRTYHKLYRKRLARGKYRDIERPVLINNWEGTYFDFDEDKLVNIASCAKEAGVEMLVLDDGWFGIRNNDKTSLGDWYANRDKLPNGIPGLVKRINKIGMKFGLWFEPEMVSPESNLYREHPDWCLHVESRGRSLGRTQFILDLSREDVQNYIIGFMKEHLSSANIEYIKWDMNRNMSCVGSAKLPPERQPEVAHRYMIGLYKILEELTTSFPDVLFEGCASGGGRFDAGQMHYFNQYWTSDDTDAVERMYIQHGTSVVMPSAFMGAHVSAVPNHQLSRTTSLKTRGLVAMNGQFGYELDVTKMTLKERTEIAEQVKEYKSIREIVHNGYMYRLVSPYESENASWEYVSEDKNSVVLFYFTIKTIAQPRPVRVKLRGLDVDKCYHLRGTDKVYSGSVLMNYGIRIKQKTDAASDMFVFEVK